MRGSCETMEVRHGAEHGLMYLVDTVARTPLFLRLLSKGRGEGRVVAAFFLLMRRWEVAKTYPGLLLVGSYYRDIFGRDGKRSR